ncbi:helicase-associated domain-containing protein [Salinispira pacifica]
MTTLERWRSILLTLNDGAFFDIIRNYLGEIKTPFNKHELIGRLESFLVNPENQRRILALIDGEDAVVLEAVDLLDEPSYDMLFSYLGDEFSYVELHHRLLNLADRLLICRDPDEKTVSLNPLIRPVLRNRLLRRERVFPGLPLGGAETGDAGSELPWLNDSLVLALLSYLFTTAEIFKTDGTLRKKNEEELRAAFGELLEERRGAVRRFDMAITMLETVGAIRREESRLVPSRRAIESVAALPSRERHELYWASALFSGRDRIQEETAFLRALTESLPSSTAYPPRVMEKICLALYLRTARHEPVSRYPAAGYSLPASASRLTELRGGARAEEEEEESPARKAVHGLVAGLQELGVLVQTEGGDLVLNPHLGTAFAEAGSPEEPALIIQPTFSVTIKPWLPLSTALPVAIASQIRRFDLYPQYEITKASFGRALASGYEAEEIELLLAALAGKPLPQNVAFSLDNWASEYASIALYEGVVLVADEQRRFLVEHSQRMEPYIVRRLAPGVYLLDPRERSAWEEVLREEGIEMLPHAAGGGDPGFLPARLLTPGSGRPATRPPRNLELFELSERERNADAHAPDGSIGSEGGESVGEGSPPADADPLPDAEEIERDLQSALDALEMQRDKREEIAERIKRKLIVHPSQISPHITRGERIEAKGLDYTGKVRLIEQVLQDLRVGGRGESLEIVRRTPRGAPSRAIVRPVELEKSGTQLILVGLTIPDEREVRIPVSKMVLVRKLKGTLFG